MSENAAGGIFKRLLSHRVIPEDVYRKNHGVDFDGDGHVCECGYKWRIEDYPVTKCPTCGKDLQERCNTSGCISLCQPNGDKSYWWRPDPYCGACLLEQSKSERLSRMESVPGELYNAAVNKYWRRGHRHGIDSRLGAWIKSGCGKSDPGMRVIYIHGSVGAGKTVSAIRAANRAVMDGIVKSFLFIREAELIGAAKSMFGQESEKNMKILERAKRVRLLMVDEMFARPEAYTEHVSHTLGDLFAQRFEKKLPGLFTSNEPPMWGSVFDQRIRSRFDLISWSERVVAQDMRKTESGRIYEEESIG
jgi:DNA replication protein DnaC